MDKETKRFLTGFGIFGTIVTVTCIVAEKVQGAPPPGALPGVINNINIKPDPCYSGDPLSISITMSNPNSFEIRQRLQGALAKDGEVIKEIDESVRLEPGTRMLEWQMTTTGFGAGTYSLTLDGVTTTFTLISKPGEILTLIVVQVIDRKRMTRPAGLKIVLDGSIIKYTEEGGIARFENVEPGDHTIQVVSDVYTQLTGFVVRVSEENIYSVNVYLEPIEVLCGGVAWFIDAESGEAVASVIDIRHFSATVTMTSPSGEIWIANLRSHSSYDWGILPYKAGYWVIKVEPEGVWSIGD